MLAPEPQSPTVNLQFLPLSLEAVFPGTRVFPSVDNRHALYLGALNSYVTALRFQFDSDARMMGAVSMRVTITIVELE